MTLTEVLATVTVAMPVILTAAHAFRSVAHKLYEHALTTPGVSDDKAIARMVYVADWLDAAAVAIAHAASLGVLKRSELGSASSESPGAPQ